MTGALTKWNMADGTPVTFQDVRPSAKTAEPEPDPLITPSPGEVAGHEARHASAALLLGLPITEARSDWPDPFGTKGHVVGYVKYADDIDWHDPKMQRNTALMTLVGDMSPNRNPKAVGYTGTWPPTWPPVDKLGADSDEAVLAAYVKAARLDEAGWNALCEEARALARMDEFKQLTTLFEVLLERGTVLDTRMLKDAYDAVIQRSLSDIRGRLALLKADITQFARELDERERISDQIRQETRDLMFNCMNTARDTTTPSTPAHVVVEVRTA